jgi:hypothetical protein
MVADRPLRSVDDMTTGAAYATHIPQVHDGQLLQRRPRLDWSALPPEVRPGAAGEFNGEELAARAADVGRNRFGATTRTVHLPYRPSRKR